MSGDLLTIAPLITVGLTAVAVLLSDGLTPSRRYAPIAVALAGLGLTLGRIVEQATNAPITLQGVVWMALIAACIFSITLVIQRKGAGRGFAIGLSTVLFPAGPLIALTLGNWLPGLPPILLALLLIRGLRGASAREWLSEI